MLELIELPNLLKSVAEQALVQARNKQQRPVIEQTRPCVVPGTARRSWQWCRSWAHNAMKWAVVSHCAPAAREAPTSRSPMSAAVCLQPPCRRSSSRFRRPLQPLRLRARLVHRQARGRGARRRRAGAHHRRWRCVFTVELPCTRRCAVASFPFDTLYRFAPPNTSPFYENPRSTPAVLLAACSARAACALQRRGGYTRGEKDVVK